MMLFLDCLSRGHASGYAGLTRTAHTTPTYMPLGDRYDSGSMALASRHDYDESTVSPRFGVAISHDFSCCQMS